ncbi:CinA family protein [uncultured Muribaculum sp.]|uniref:CinA family protein n=1 Tax=uncultured Muribaculum sp. TaxID=1918613 RepID=UPI0025DF9A0F|nr:CinA family protein [uncultured Muribaculum sp.]
MKNSLTQKDGLPIPVKGAREIFSLLAEKHLTLSTAESCTGGNIAHNITLIPGSSEIFKGGIVSYSNEVKHMVLGVREKTLAEHGAVSRQVVEQMAEGACRVCDTDCSVATSGIAGPGGAVPGKPVGTVWIAARYHDTIRSGLFMFSGSREEIISIATSAALSLLYSTITSPDNAPSHDGF